MKQFKRIISLLMILITLCTAPVFAAGESGGTLQNFKKGTALSFSDVGKKSWYYANVSSVTALGLMQGESTRTFAPEGTLTVAEAVAVTARFHAIYTEGSSKRLEKMSSSPWYERYFKDLSQKKLVSYSLIDRAEETVTRELVAILLSSVIEQKDLKEINLLHSIPDADTALEKSLLPLYRAGVLTGNDLRGTFAPDSSITRAELAAVLSRMALPKLRKRVTFVPTGRGKLSHFESVTVYDGRFLDVPKKAWFYENVALCYEYGLMQGEKKKRFNAEGNITLSEVAAVAARFHCIFLTGDTEMLDRFPKGKVWYQPYYDYLEGARLLPEDFKGSPESAATREQALGIFARLLKGKLTEINTVAAIPDYMGNDHDAFLHLYRAGVLTGSDGYGSMRPDERVNRAEMAAILSRIVEPALRREFTLKEAPASAFVYGKSGAGRTLGGWRIGNGKKALVLTFAIHGWEDNFPQDGQMMVNTAHALIDQLKSRPDKLRGWTVYVLPCCNPDGLLEGSSCDGQGRRTVYSYNSAGTLVNKGIDLNRSFPYGYKRTYDKRNYNAPAPLAAPEAVALQQILLKVSSEHSVRYFIDVHGWYNQIITKDSDLLLRNAFLANFPKLQKETLGGNGYISGYAHSLGYHAALFEFPHDVWSAEEFEKSGYQQKFINSVFKLLEI